MRAYVVRADRIPGAVGFEPASKVWTNPTRAFEDVPEPTPSPTQIVVKPIKVGICGSDLHVAFPDWHGGVAFGGPASMPVVLGHEFSGMVVDVGKAAKRFKPGDIVTAESICACWRCSECHDGHLNECASVELLGLTQDGALASFVAVDERHCYRVEAILDLFGRDLGHDVAATLEPMGCALRGLRAATVGPTDRLVVVGAGPIGLAVVALARTLGVAEIVVFELDEKRALLAQAMGAQAVTYRQLSVFDASPRQFVREITKGRMATVCVEAAGSTDAFSLAFECLAPRGRLLQLGRAPSNPILDINALMSKGIKIIGSRGHAGYGIFPALIDLIVEGKLDPRPLITSRFDFGGVESALLHARDMSPGKTIISMAGG